MTQCKEGSQRAGLMLDSSEELYKWFTQQVMNNLHVVLTMNPSAEGNHFRGFQHCLILRNGEETPPGLAATSFFGSGSTWLAC